MTTTPSEMEILFAACGRGDDVEVLDPSLERLRPALRHMIRVGASDLHLKAGSRPRVRVNGHLHPAPVPALGPDDCERIVAQTMPAAACEQLRRTGAVDYTLQVDGIGRFRVSAFRQRGSCAFAIRSIPSVVPNAERLGLLPAVRRLAMATTGLCLVAGRVGSGKTTTLAWIVDRINDTRDANIVTIEDPIEFVHADKRSIVHQREVGTDTETYAEALRRVVRHDPDIIVIGEVRDELSARAALSAAQTGHLVFATLHTDSAADAIDRFVDLFPAPAHASARQSLSAALHTVVCQRLVPAGDNRRILAQEVLVATGRIAERIVDPAGPGPSIADMVADDEHLGMLSFDQHLLALCRAGAISEGDAVAAATHAHDLRLRLACS
jgi:twitching motility protein PilT